MIQLLLLYVYQQRYGRQPLLFQCERHKELNDMSNSNPLAASDAKQDESAWAHTANYEKEEHIRCQKSRLLSVSMTPRGYQRTTSNPRPPT